LKVEKDTVKDEENTTPEQEPHKKEDEVPHNSLPVMPEEIFLEREKTG